MRYARAFPTPVLLHYLYKKYFGEGKTPKRATALARTHHRRIWIRNQKYLSQKRRGR